MICPFRRCCQKIEGWYLRRSSWLCRQRTKGWRLSSYSGSYAVCVRSGVGIGAIRLRSFRGEGGPSRVVIVGLLVCCIRQLLSL